MAADLSVAVERLESEITDLRQERDELRDELAAARLRIKSLEDAQTEAINRIDWVIESIHTVVEAASST